MIKKFESFTSDPDLEIFVDYMRVYYAEGGIFEEYFDGTLTVDDINRYAPEFIKKRKALKQWSGSGDSFDREYFRDYLLFKIKGIIQTEHNIKPYLTELEIATNQYNL